MESLLIFVYSVTLDFQKSRRCFPSKIQCEFTELIVGTYPKIRPYTFIKKFIRGIELLLESDKKFKDEFPSPLTASANPPFTNRKLLSR
jgi:hypothetical protein